MKWMRVSSAQDIGVVLLHCAHNGGRAVRSNGLLCAREGGRDARSGDLFYAPRTARMERRE